MFIRNEMSLLVIQGRFWRVLSTIFKSYDLYDQMGYILVSDLALQPELDSGGIPTQCALPVYIAGTW